MRENVYSRKMRDNLVATLSCSHRAGFCGAARRFEERWHRLLMFHNSATASTRTPKAPFRRALGCGPHTPPPLCTWGSLLSLFGL